jgi:acyl-CoA thioester hydrolase
MPEGVSGEAPAGRIEDGVHRLALRVYYEDTDVSGLVYHANYLKFCERGRSDCLRLLGIHHADLRDPRNCRGGFVVRRMFCDFERSASLDDILVVETRIAGLTGARLLLRQEIARARERLFAAEVTVALLDGEGRARRLPASAIAALSPIAATKTPA